MKTQETSDRREGSTTRETRRFRRAWTKTVNDRTASDDFTSSSSRMQGTGIIHKSNKMFIIRMLKITLGIQHRDDLRVPQWRRDWLRRDFEVVLIVEVCERFGFLHALRAVIMKMNGQRIAECHAQGAHGSQVGKHRSVAVFADL